MNRRERIFQKFNGLCAYSGTPLEPDWQIDHINPVIRSPYSATVLFPKDDIEDNMVPAQKIINHYKRAFELETFRSWILGELHLRLKKLPVNPYAEKSIKHKAYLLKVAAYFNITPEKPFSGMFYFETLQNNKHTPDEISTVEVW